MSRKGWKINRLRTSITSADHSHQENIIFLTTLINQSIVIMSSPKLITIFGGTGSQGGSVIQSLLKNKSKAFSIRAITRNPDSESAKALTSQGVEIVKADSFNKKELRAAFEGSWGAFVNTKSEDPVRPCQGRLEGQSQC